MTEDEQGWPDAQWLAAVVATNYKSWAVRLAENAPANVPFSPTWEDVDRLVSEIVDLISNGPVDGKRLAAEAGRKLRASKTRVVF